ncbi:hypothetical protein LTR40_007122 [Exophiala xenobiotica]|nr:hypothetical protein LTR40_007122 [Exophiala xenobiotica]
MAENDPSSPQERNEYADDISLEAVKVSDELIPFQAAKGGGYAAAFPLEVQDEDDYAENIPLMSREEDEHSESSPAPTAVDTRSHSSRFKECAHAVGQVLKSALPTYCVPSQISSPRDSPTAYLDALRGYAAFFVYIFHLYDRQDEVTWRRYPFIYRKNFGAQLLHWFNDVFKFCNPFSANVTDLKDNDPLSSDYLPQMWTIPVEFRGSVFLFAFCTAICKLTPRARMLVMWLIIVVSYCWQAVYIAEFTGGLFIAQLSLCRHPERISGAPRLPTNNDEKPAPGQSLISKIAHVSTFIVGFLLLGEVDGGHAELLLWKRFPWAYLNKAIPFWWPETGHYVFWLGWGSLALVYSLEFYPALQRPLGWKVSRYLGDISFGLYAMHVPFGMGIKQQFLDSWRQTHLGESIWAYMLMALVITLIVITAADYFTKIDRALVRSARQLQDRLFTSWN